MEQRNDTIAAIATGQSGALAVIRVSGSGAIAVCDSVFVPASGHPLAASDGYTLHYGTLCDGGEVLDEVVVSLYRAPRSYTGEDVVEISCHGSSYVQREIMSLLARRGVRQASAGEFTVRAFLAGKLDLSQAEAVADIIASESRAELRMAQTQMRGTYVGELAALRSRLLELASLFELELDFGEEEVEFADRDTLAKTVSELKRHTDELVSTFRLGNAVKEGVPVAIVGPPNVGKSTLLNALLKEERAMVSDIPGTTRDTVEESVNIGGVKYRFIDTAGLRVTDDRLEQMGIERTRNSLAKADIVLYVTEAQPSPITADEGSTGQKSGSFSLSIPWDDVASLALSAEQRLYIVLNKTDRLPQPIENYAFTGASGARWNFRPLGDSSDRPGAEYAFFAADNLNCTDTPSEYRQKTCCNAGSPEYPDTRLSDATREQSGRTYVSVPSDKPVDADIPEQCRMSQQSMVAPEGGAAVLVGVIPVVAKTGEGVDTLGRILADGTGSDRIFRGEAIVSSARHHEALLLLSEALGRVSTGLQTVLPPDLIAQDIRQALHHLGEITGEITADDILSEIFSKFCIGK